MINIKDFIARLDFKPKYDDCDPCPICSVAILNFKRKNGIEPSIEFGTETSDDDGKQYFYYEAIDFTNYEDGAFIKLDSPLRLHPTYIRLCEENFEETVKLVNGFLHEVYDKK